ncbi:anoctamin-like protein Os01g0706700 isoform X2 [Nymphaea colorata]|uniref:anoctamin-like protein Os01g0706700 isoform X2 n=1 Tax=Nymphaea colorata TaxID=210225 RepID=UPI00129E5F6D|nr:anoctamin-like protein Os01g0706700 isoform X2 [Nymphaea colorata]
MAWIKRICAKFAEKPYEMRTGGEETDFEFAIAVPRRPETIVLDVNADCAVEVLVAQLRKSGFYVERVRGVFHEFIKLGAPLEALGRAAAELKLRKPTSIGMDLQFEWDQVSAFIRQRDGSLFSWRERFRCYKYMMKQVVNSTDLAVTLRFGENLYAWHSGESLLKLMESVGMIKKVYPLHVERKRKQLMQSWALNCFAFTSQPIDDIHSYFGTKIAVYFAFLGMYTNWLFFPAAFGIFIQLFDFGSWQLWALPVFFVFIISWAVLFFQFWKRKNCALLTRWQICYPEGLIQEQTVTISGQSSPDQLEPEISDGLTTNKPKERYRALQRDEWRGIFKRFRNDVLVIMGIICLQLPFELAYAYLYEAIGIDILRYALTALYLLIIQYYTRLGGKVSIELIKNENNQSRESKSDSLVYKVFGVYFMQTYIGVFYHVLLHRDFVSLHQVLVQRLIVSLLLDNLLDNSIPFLKYSYKKYRTFWKRKCQIEARVGNQPASRVEKEYMKPSYSASIGAEVEDGLFDDSLKLVLQFGLVMLFACAFPLAFCFAVLYNMAKIRIDALKLLTLLQRPIPRAAPTMGAWLNIFQFLIVVSICTNCGLLVFIYDEERKWRIEPGLAAILAMEHVLLLLKFGFSNFVPEEPAWVKANRFKHVQAQDMCSKDLLKNICNRGKKED